MTALPGLPKRAVNLRTPDQVMTLERMGASFPTRLSFMRTLVREMMTGRWRFEASGLELDHNGFGHGVWRIATPDGVLSFVAFSTALDASERTDRVIAEKWDASFVLVKGEVTDRDIDRLAAHVPRQEAGRLTAKELVLSRANKSVRLFEAVVDALAGGVQPDRAELAQVGYLMRTTAVYGNGKFGLGDFACAAAYACLDAPFRAEMVMVFLIRNFQFELVEHVARARGGAKAVTLDAGLKRMLGVGNATGLGMAPFLVRHPMLLHSWINARETALARVLGVARAGAADSARFTGLLQRAQAHCGQWNVADERQQARIEVLRGELNELAGEVAGGLAAEYPWRTLFDRQAGHSLELQELLAGLLIELYPALVDDLAGSMGHTGHGAIDGTLKLEDLKRQIEADYGWALNIDFSQPGARAVFWYYSAAKNEPRLGRRDSEPGADREMRLGTGAMVKALYDALAALGPKDLEQSLARYLLAHPQWRFAARRVVVCRDYPYSEIKGNLVGKDMLPIDLLRCKLAFFGATKFDPKSDLWTRITMFQGGPLMEDLCDETADDWWLPVI